VGHSSGKKKQGLIPFSKGSLAVGKGRPGVQVTQGPTKSINRPFLDVKKVPKILEDM